MSGSLLERHPCPDRILDDAGGGFAMGVVGGSAFHFLKGRRNSPMAMDYWWYAGYAHEPPASRRELRCVGRPLLRLGCTTVYIHQKEDPWNSIVAGASTMGVLSLRRVLRAIAAKFPGRTSQCSLPTVPTLIATGLPQPHVSSTDLSSSSSSFPGLRQPPVYPTEVASSSVRGSRLGGLLGKEEEKKSTSIGGTAEILESFEMPSPPIPSFEYKRKGSVISALSSQLSDFTILDLW
ncbi:hypothetical protein ACQ4PT_052004 [Festuca glaucescens]